MDPTQIGTGVFAACSAFWAALQTYQNTQKQKQLNEVSAKASENTEAAAVSHQYAERIQKLEKDLEDWKKRYDSTDMEWRARYDRQHSDQQKDREQHEKDRAQDRELQEKQRTHWHKNAEESNAKQLVLQEENAILRARTDLKPLIEVLASMREDRKEDMTIRERMLDAMNVFSESINRLHERLDTIESTKHHEAPH